VKSERYAFILVSDEKYWNKLREHTRANKGDHAFVRKNQVAPLEAQKLLFYVKKPIMQIQGAADFIERITGDREELWRAYGTESCFDSLDEYHTFAQGRKKMTFVRFKNFTELKNPKTTEAMRNILGSLQGFRGKYVSLKTASQLIT
jgi:predicted transcriptional regulator